MIFISKEKNREKLTGFIEKHLKESLGYEVEVMLSTYIELSKVVNENPFNKIEYSKNDKLHVAFMALVPAVLPELPFVIEKFGITFFKLIKNMIFMVARPVTGVNGLPANFVEKHFNVKVTIRNWNTVNKIVEKYGD